MGCCGNLVSAAGVVILIGGAWSFCPHKKKVNWRLIFFATALQACFAFFVFVLPVGTSIFLWVNKAVLLVLDSASAGARFVFGPLALPPGAEGAAGEESLGFILAFQAFPTIIFFSALMAVLYYLRIMPRLISAFAKFFTRLLRISGAESLCATSNIFVGVESALTIRPYLERMTPSELCTVLTAGMATVASNVLALYVFTLQQQFPTIAGHLVSASFLAAPSALIMSKLLLPEAGAPETMGVAVSVWYEREDNLFAAVIAGANAGVRVVVGIVALLLAVLGLVALFDLVISTAGGYINMFAGTGIDWTLKGLLGYVFYPFTLIIGIPFSDAAEISRIIGERAVLTEIAAYRDLAALMEAGALEHGRSAVVAAYALCGFAHVASLAIFVGGISAIAPGTTNALTRVGPRALAAATLACLLTACYAGVFFNEGSLLMG